MEDIVPILIPTTFFVLFFSERFAPGRSFRTPPRWRWKGVLFFFISAGINVALPALFVGAVGAHTPLHLGGLGLVLGGLVAFLASDFVSYWLHRAQHRWFPLWRWTHQMHHSAEVLDMAGAVYFHPFDIALGTVVVSLVTAGLGVSADAAALAGYLGFLWGMFQHWNVRTPQWLGYFVQRPEAHCIHHQRGVHAYNYGNVTWWDMMFGTFRNPATWEGEVGFWDGASRQMGAMLLGRDVGAPASTTAEPS